MKTAVIMQLPPAPREVPQVLVWEKSPLAWMLEIETGVVPVFVRVETWADPPMPACCVPNISSGGFRTRLVPVAVSAICCGLLGSLSVKVRVAVLGPGLAGLKVTFTVQLVGLSLCSGCTPLAQVLVWVNSESPLMAILVNFRTWLVLKLRRVTVCTGLGVFTCWVW